MPKLTPITVRNAKPGRHADGGGLYLFVRESGSRQWILRVVVPSHDGAPNKRRDFGMGSAANLSLADARAKAAEWREVAKQGRDPSLLAKEADRALAAEEARRGVTFADAASAAFDALSPAWRNPKHRAQWINTIEEYANPSLGALLVDEVDAPAIIDALGPIWLAKPETARRVRQRIGTVLDFAHARRWRDRESPMKAVTMGLPKQTKPSGNHAAVPYAKAPAVIEKLREATSTMGRLALLFTVFTVARSGETRGARWSEIDMEAATWTVPADRMKARRPHVVPLTEQALTILRDVEQLKRRDDDLLFPGIGNRPLSDMTMAKAAKLAAPGSTVHGWRSSFRDWTAEQTNFAGEIAEMALAHSIGNKVEAAYRRGNLLEKRRALMAAWADYLDGNAATVSSLDDARRKKLAG